MYLVIGANGFLGSYILKVILENTCENIIATTRNIENTEKNTRVKWISCDVSNFVQVDYLCNFLSTISKEKLKVVYLAAYHNPDLVEKNPNTAWNINVTALSYILNKLENVECFFYPSTDSVYGESSGGYHFKEADKLNPVNIYGKQKVIAEHLVTGYGYNVVRYPFLISPSLTPVKKHFYDNIVFNLQTGKSVEMFKDSFRSTISFNQAADILIQLMEGYSKKLPQILNICGDDDLSKYDVGLLIADKLGVSREKIVPISINENSGIFQANRASSTLMDNSLLKKILQVKKIKLEL